jgi:hypothetical protein
VARGNVTARQDSEVATQENMDSIENDGGANVLIMLAKTGLVDRAAAAAAAISAPEEAHCVQ